MSEFIGYLAVVSVAVAAQAWAIVVAWGFFAAPYGWPPMPWHVGFATGLLLWGLNGKVRAAIAKVRRDGEAKGNP